MITQPQILDRLASWLCKQVEKDHVPGNGKAPPNFFIRFDTYDDRTHLLTMVACEAAIVQGDQQVILLVDEEDMGHDFLLYAKQTYEDVLTFDTLSSEEEDATIALKQAYAVYASQMLDENMTPDVHTFLYVVDDVRAAALNATQLSARDRDSAVLREEETSYIHKYAPLEALHTSEIARLLMYYGLTPAEDKTYTQEWLRCMPNVSFFVDMETTWDFTSLSFECEEAIQKLEEVRKLPFNDDEKEILAHYFEYSQTPEKQQALYTRTPSRTLILKEVLT